MTNPSTQQFLDIETIKENTLILKNKSLRGILMVSSINFALRSEDEQQSIIFQFQDFLNSLDFALQIIVQSRQLNITGYLEKLKEIEKRQDNELLKIQVLEYRNFVENLIKEQVIMSKSFYVIIPFSPLDISVGSATKGLLGKQQTPELKEESFTRARLQLFQRMEFVALGLGRCGLQSAALNTEELIELLWSTHHPSEAETGYYPEIPPELKE